MPNLIRNFLTCFSLFTFSSITAFAQDTYVYDDAGRLKSTTFGSGGPLIEYKYDDANNRTEEKTTGVVNTILCTYGGTSPLNLRDLLNNNPNDECGASYEGYTGMEAIDVEVTITSNINGSGTSNTVSGKYAIKTGTWPSNEHSVSLKLIINSGKNIRGGGGRGGNGGSFYSSGGTPGKAAGHAIYMEEDLEIVNNGTIKGGGGGGGGGDASIEGSGDDGYYSSFGGGGGGGGFPNGARGLRGSDIGYPGTHGVVGTTSGGGNGGNLNGGNGGNAGAAGQAGGSVAGAGGYGIKKNGNILVLTGSGSNSGTGS